MTASQKGRPAIDDLGKHAGRIRAARTACGMSQAGLADALGVTKSAVTNWESGRARPDIDTLKGICAALRVSSDELLGIVPPEGRPTAAERLLLASYRSLSRHDQLSVSRLIDAMHQDQYEDFRRSFQTRFLRRALSPLHACAGTGVALPDGGAREQLLLRACRETFLCDEIIAITGDSMEPVYHSGDRVLVEHAERVAPGEVGVFVVAGEGMIKVYQRDGLHPLNPAYPVVRPAADDGARCVGRVLCALSEEMLPNREERAMIDELNAGHGR